MRAAAAAQHEDVVTWRNGRCAASRDRAHSQRREREHEAKPGREVVRDGMPRDNGAVVRGEPDRLGLGDEVADRQHQAVVADHDTASRSFGAQDWRGERVVRNVGAQGDHRVDRGTQIELHLSAAGLHRGGKAQRVDSDTEECDAMRARRPLKVPMLREPRAGRRFLRPSLARRR
jgi:hypothetical protein